ncbi:MAG: helix-turn-helix domain-containing protein, partial [Myxococcota bacterium]
MSEELITTTEAARVLGVGPSTVKRWADDGLLACVRTAGGHRRFLTEEILRFKQQGYGSEGSGATDHWLDLLISEDADPFQINAALLQARGDASSWWEVCASLAPVLSEIGTRWARGELAIAEEHVASERLARGLAFVTQSIGVAPRSPACVLVTVEGDDHTLGLSMVEVCAREAGWSTIWLGRSTPIT